MKRTGGSVVLEVLAFGSLLTVAACGETAASESQPSTDAGHGHSDTGGGAHTDARPAHDAVSDVASRGPDAAIVSDAGADHAAPPPDVASPPPPMDARTPVEAATGDAGPSGPFPLAAACTGTPASVYAAVPNLPPMTDALRGDIVACTNDGVVTLTSVQSQLTSEADTGVTAVTGVTIYRVQYRTTRANGSAATSSARVYLPLIPVESTPPVIVASHGTEGLAASCTTSMDSTSMRDLALPWAALGYPVIAPDYAGLGTPGVQGYTDNHDTARSVVDSVEALRKFTTATLARDIVIDGHSQGGGAALATQALAASMNIDGNLRAVVTFAPEYYSHLDSLGFLLSLESVAVSNPLTISTGVTKCEVAALIEYQYFANYVPTGLPIAGFPANIASELGTAIESDCTIPLGGAIQLDAPHVGDWTDATLRGQLLACVAADGADGGTFDAGPGDAGAVCTGAGQAFYAYLKQNIVPPDPSGAPVLLVQGLEDIVMPPAEEAACNVIQLEAGGVTPQVCTDATASHTDVVNRNIAFGISWAQAVLAGASPPSCSADNLPACSAP